MLLRKSGDPNATDQAIQNFEEALVETPNDPVATHALATMLERKDHYQRVVQLLTPLLEHPSRKTRELALPVILHAYERMGETLKALEIRRRLEENDL